MLKITVKTLDSQNYQFEANDSWTIQQFKEHIQPTVNVDPTEQRLIFCGRVLQNDKKLTEYDCDGKVVHLVRRPPPIGNPNQDSHSAADSNNNSSSSDNNVGEGNILLNAIFVNSAQPRQAMYLRATGEGGSFVDSSTTFDTEQRLNNAARLIRMTAGILAEYAARSRSVSPNTPNPPAASESSSLDVPRSIITAASSHTDLQCDDAMQTNDTSTDSRQHSTLDATIDDINLSADREARSSIPRQSLTTDDLPQSRARHIGTISAPQGRERVTRSTVNRNREQFELERYLTILDCSIDLQVRTQALIRRYTQLINMSRRGGLIVPQNQSQDSPVGSQNADQGSSTQAAGPSSSSDHLSSSLLREARLLGLHLPRIQHHIGHLQHALSDFTVDFARGRLLSARNAPQLARRSVPSLTSDSERQNPSRVGGHQRRRETARRTGPRLGSTLEGSLMITATNVEATPITNTTSASNLRPTANATIVLTTEPGQSGIHIPVSFPIPMRRATATSTGPLSSGRQNENQQESNMQDRGPQQQDRPRTQQQHTSSTQTVPHPLGLLSTEPPLPFDYYLHCNSPWANYGLPPRPVPRTVTMPTARVQFRTSGGSSVPHVQMEGPVAPSTQSGINNASTNREPQVAPTLDGGLTDVVTNILGSILAPNSPPGTATPSVNAAVDSLLLLPQVGLNLANQILGRNFAAPSPVISGNRSASQPQQQQQTNSSTAPVMMDIDIDDSSSSQSESRYQDAVENNSPNGATALTRQVSGQTATPSGSGHQENTQPRADSRSRLLSSPWASVAYDRVVRMMNDHPEWVPIIERDLDLMRAQNSRANSNSSSFSDAYLSSIPRKRRRLTANPDRVFILQPSPPEAISNLLRRAIMSSMVNVGSVAGLDQLLDAISNDINLQQAYEDYIKSAVETRLRSDYDYCPSKFENSSKYFK